MKKKQLLYTMIKNFCYDNNYDTVNFDETLNNGIILLQHHEYSDLMTSYIEIDLFNQSVRPYKLLKNDKYNQYADILAMYELIELYDIIKYFKENC